MINLLISLALVFQTSFNSKLSFDYSDADVLENAVTHFLVCLDGQVTSACTKIDISSGITSTTAGDKTYSYTFPALKAGSHRVAVQACNLNSVTCSSGSVLDFSVQLVIPNPKNLRLVK